MQLQNTVIWNAMFVSNVNVQPTGGTEGILLRKPKKKNSQFVGDIAITGNSAITVNVNLKQL